MRLTGELQTRNRQAHTHSVTIQIGRDISTAEVPPEEQRVPAQPRAPLPMHQCQEGVPLHLAVKISGDCIQKRQMATRD